MDDQVSKRDEWLSEDQRRAFFKVTALMGPIVIFGVGWGLLAVSPKNGGEARSVWLLALLFAAIALSAYTVGRRFRARSTNATWSSGAWTWLVFAVAPAAGVIVAQLVGGSPAASLVVGLLGVSFLLWVFAFLYGLNWGRIVATARRWRV